MLQAFGHKPIVRKIRERLTEKEALDTERLVIAAVGRVDKNAGPLTNMTDGGDGISGAIVSEETRKKRSRSLKGKIPWNIGMVYPEDVRLKMSQTYHRTCASWTPNRRLHTEEEKRRISLALTGRPVSKETRLKISKSHKGKTLSQETRKKISDAKKGQKLPREVVLRIAEANRGRKHGPLKPEAKAKLSQSLKSYYSLFPKQADGPLHGQIRAASRLGVPLDEYLKKTQAGLKRCPRCRSWKEVGSFSPTSNGRRTSWCRGCRRVPKDESITGSVASPPLFTAV